jgi:hypothetical protein
MLRQISLVAKRDGLNEMAYGWSDLRRLLSSEG